MDKDKLDKYVDLLSKDFEELENTLQFLSFAYLLQNYKKPQQWFNLQQANLKRFKTKVNEIATEKLKEINQNYTNTLLLAYAMATGVKVLRDDEKKELTINVSDKFDNHLNQMLNANKTMVAQLVANINNNHITAINQINSAVVLNLPKTEELYQQITTSIDNYGVNNNLKVVYKNGRVVDWKVYMEMNVRTTMSQEITSYQVDSGKANKVVFWLCSQHSDCADDHIDYQGKLYYDDNWRMFGFDTELTQQIDNIIKQKKMMSIQDVKDKEPYLTTRPNCRHYFQPIAIKDVLTSNTKDLLNRLKMNKGKGDKQKYDDLVQQRYNERQIRKWKKQRQIYEMESLANPNDLTAQKRLGIANQKIRDWQATQRRHLKGKSYLERDYNRESNEILVNDLGYRFNKLTNK